MEQVFRSIAVRVNGPRAAEAGRMLLRRQFTDLGETWTLLVPNGALTPIRGDAPCGATPNVTLRLARTTLDAVLTGTTSFAEQVTSAAISLDGDARVLATFATLTDRSDPNLPIVTP